MNSTAMPMIPNLPPQCLERVRSLLADGRRKLLGLVGPPGSGKSTLASALRQTFPADSQIVPMDGFHLANSELVRQGLRHRKGAPETFDAAGYAALLQRFRHQRADETIYAPEFERALEEPIAGAIAVHATTRLVITEGNYLLLDGAPWSSVAPLLDEVWYVDVDDALRTERLLQRHERFGRSRQQALEWVASVDEPNARLIERSRVRATLDFRWDAS